MKTIIQQLSREMLEEIVGTILEAELNLEQSSMQALEISKRYARKIMKEVIQAADEALLAAKAERCEAGLVVERKHDTRTVMTQLGELRYERTYYQSKWQGGYSYPIDDLIGLQRYSRVDDGLSKKLVQESRHNAYQRAVDLHCEGKLSKQTVLHKIRRAHPVIEQPKELRRVAELHVDADEDHVAMQSKKYRGRKIVPLVSVYEGLEEHGKRRSCRNVFHISPYGQDPDTLWEGVISRIEQRYDLTGTQIYLHGDGAAWIAKGLEWLPNATFVLDMYHKNKAVKSLLAGYDSNRKAQLFKDFHQALRDMDEAYFDNIVGLLLSHSLEREEKIKEAATYLRSHMSAIAVRYKDASARNGGATEPHIRHVLSSRLSSRPKGWSDKTLRTFAPILANGPDVSMRRTEENPIHPLAQKAVQKVRQQCPAVKRHNLPFQASLWVTQKGQCTSLYSALKGLVSQRLC